MLKVNNYIYVKFNERGMKSFETKVARLLKVNNIEGTVICHDAYMTRGSGRGSYYMCADIEINGEIITLKEHTNDSEFWDNWDWPSTKRKRDLFLFVLEKNIVNCLLN